VHSKEEYKSHNYNQQNCLIKHYFRKNWTITLTWLLTKMPCQW